MKHVISFITFLYTFYSFAQDQIILKDSTILEGTIVEQVPLNHLKIKPLNSNETLQVNYNEIARLKHLILNKTNDHIEQELLLFFSLRYGVPVNNYESIGFKASVGFPSNIFTGISWRQIEFRTKFNNSYELYAWQSLHLFGTNIGFYTKKGKKITSQTGVELGVLINGTPENNITKNFSLTGDQEKYHFYHNGIYGNIHNDIYFKIIKDTYISSSVNLLFSQYAYSEVTITDSNNNAFIENKHTITSIRKGKINLRVPIELGVGIIL